MLSALDWFIFIILLGGLIRGYMVGAVRQVASVIGIVAALLFSVEFMEPMGELVVSSLGLSESLIPLSGFTVLFVGVYLLFLALSRLLEQVLDSLSLSVVNQIAGGAVGGGKAALLLSLLFLVLSGMELPEKDTRNQSAFYQPIAQLLPRTIAVAEEWMPAAKKAADQLGRRIRSEVQSRSESSSGSAAMNPEFQGPHGRSRASLGSEENVKRFARYDHGDACLKHGSDSILSDSWPSLEATSRSICTSPET